MTPQQQADNEHDQDIEAEIENNIRQLRSQATPTPQPTYSTARPLQLIAGGLQALTYGTMMQFAQELKALSKNESLSSPADIAALIHLWALNHGKSIEELQALNPTPKEEPLPTLTSDILMTPSPLDQPPLTATPLPEVTPTPLA